MSGSTQRTLGWREWVALPGLAIPAIKAKVDTGARTSALHAHGIEYFRRQRREWVRFCMHPLQHNTELTVPCEAEVSDRRVVTDSGGHRERRYVITTVIRLGADEWPIELTLTKRNNMLFRMLLGRTAVAGRFVVDPRRSFLTGRPDIAKLYPQAANKKKANRR